MIFVFEKYLSLKAGQRNAGTLRLSPDYEVHTLFEILTELLFYRYVRYKCYVLDFEHCNEYFDLIMNDGLFFFFFS